MTEKQRQLCERVAKQLKMSPERAKNYSLEDLILLLVVKMENDMIDIEDMFTHMNTLKEHK